MMIMIASLHIYAPLGGDTIKVRLIGIKLMLLTKWAYHMASGEEMMKFAIKKNNINRAIFI